MNEEIKDFHLPRWNELPNIDLYIDQLVSFLEQYLAGYIKNDREKDEKIRSLAFNHSAFTFDPRFLPWDGGRPGGLEIFIERKCGEERKNRHESKRLRQDQSDIRCHRKAAGRLPYPGHHNADCVPLGRAGAYPKGRARHSADKQP